MKAAKGRITNVGEFLSQVAEIKEAWFRDEELSPWYRGQNRAEWGLLPSLFRTRNTYDEIRKERIEDEIREEFIVRAPVFSEFKPAGDDDWEWYFLMQHYGAPTRLLDWTEGALIALYFAVKNNPGHFDSAVWVLDPYDLNRRAIGIDEVIPPSAQGVAMRDRQRVRKWLPIRFTGGLFPGDQSRYSQRTLLGESVRNARASLFMGVTFEVSNALKTIDRLFCDGS